MENLKKKKALIVSGGGAKGAFGTGCIDYFSNVLHNEYELIVGTSTGSLMLPMIALDEIEELKKAYTSVTNKDIWKFNPFKSDGSINYFKVIYRELQGKTWGEFNLKQLLYKWFPKEQYNIVLKLNKEIISCSTDMTNGTKKYISNKDINSDYERFIDGIIASASVPVFTKPVIIDGAECMDGGILEPIALNKAIELGATDIDVIVHRTKTFTGKNWKSSGSFSHLTRLIDLMNFEIGEGDLVHDSSYKIKINFIFTPYNLTDNSLSFNQSKMVEWQKLGYETAEKISNLDKNTINSCFLRLNLKPNLKQTTI